jgi:hypothetical protein
MNISELPAGVRRLQATCTSARCPGRCFLDRMTWRRDAMKTAPKHKAEKTTKTLAPKRHPAPFDVDEMLDEALVETFPASDPVALTLPSRRRRAALRKREKHS